MTLKPRDPKHLKVMLYLKRQPNCSDEMFHRHWKTNHVELAMANAKFMSKVRRYNQVGYIACEFKLMVCGLTKSQCHTSPQLREQAAAFGIPVLDCDGIAEVWVDSLDDWKEIVNDPDFIKYIARE